METQNKYNEMELSMKNRDRFNFFKTSYNIDKINNIIGEMNIGPNDINKDIFKNIEENKNYILAEINIKEDDINKDVRILNKQ